jgi:hypothetical protein
VDCHDPVVDLARAPQVLALNARRVRSLLSSTRLVDHADRPDRIRGCFTEYAGEVPLKGVASGDVVPPGGHQKLQEGPHGSAGREGDRLGRFAGQVEEQSPAVGVEVGGGPVLTEAPAEPLQVTCERRAERCNLLLRHRYTSRGKE